MKFKQLLTKSLLAAVCLLAGQSAWAKVEETVVVNCDFSKGETLFANTSRITVSNDNNAKFVTANNSTNGYSLATYDFSSAIGTDATAVKIEFLFWMPSDNSYYRRFFTVGQSDLRTGFGKWSYSTAGSMFAFGLARNSSANYFSINGASTTAAASAGSVLGAWARAEIYVDHSAKTVDYKITDVDNTTTYYSAEDVDFVDGSASYCNQIDFYDCWNNTTSYLDNLVITKYVDKSKVATTYTVKYQNAEGTDLKDAVNYDTYVGDTYTASSSDMATFYSNDTNTKYVYKTGNTSAEAVGTAASNVITLVFDEYSKVSYTVTAKNGEATLGTLASGNAYTDGSTTVYWNKFKQFDEQWYATTGSYGKDITAAGNTDVSFTASDIAYFFEAENLNTSRSGFPTASGTKYSGGSARRNYASSQMWTSAIAEGGTFILTFPYSMANASASTVVIKTRDAEGNYTETGHSLSTSSAGTFSEEITVPAGSSVAICNDNNYNSNILVDYLTLTPKVTKTISSAGWATLYSPYALNFAEANPSGLKAYTATTDGAKVTLTPVDNVPANTGVVLEGKADTYSIPVIASSETEKGNLEGNATAATAYDAFDNTTLYILTLIDNNNVQFNPCTSGEIAAGKAFLKVATGGAKALSVMFANDPTGIANVNAAEVAQPVKRVVNGQLVIEKNGKRYNAAGAEF